MKKYQLIKNKPFFFQKKVYIQQNIQSNFPFTKLKLSFYII